MLLSSSSSCRVFSSASSKLAAATARKSFNKSNTYDKSKNRKGSGNDKSWNDSILKNNYQRKAQDTPLIEQLNEFNPKLSLKITKYQNEINRKLHIAGSFNPHQYNELYSQPLTLIRPREDIFINEFYKNSINSSSKSNRLILTGEKGVGKSTILTHFQSQVLSSNDSILLPIPYADALVDGSSDFKLNPLTNLYDQQMYSKKLLKKIINLNKDNLSKIKLSKNYNLLNKNYKQSQISLSINENNLLDLLKSSNNNNDINATEIFKILISELQLQSNFSVYLTVDNFTAFLQYGMTKYKNNLNDSIYFQKFTINDIILSLISGEKEFNKGAIVVATHGNHKWKSNKTLSVALGELNPNDFAYAKFNQFDRKFANRLLLNKDSLKNLNVSKFDINETNSIVKHLWNFNLIHNEFNAEIEMANLGHDYFNKLSQRKFIISGNGNGKLLLDSCVLNYA